MNNYYLKISIELCHDCGGKGAIAVEPVDDSPSVDTVVEGICPMCLGSGRVKKKKEIQVTLEPYV